MKDLHVVLYELRNKPHGIMPEYAAALEKKLEDFLSGESTIDDIQEEAEQAPSEEERPQSNIAVIDINGIIMKRVGVPKEILDLFGIVDLDDIDTQLRLAMADDNVKSVILNVNSPGGFITGVQSTAMLVNELSKKKEVIAYTDVLNASAAYWISSQADVIIGSVDATFGSVGVYTTVDDWSKALENEGIKVHLINAGKWKALGDPTQPLTDEAKAFLQAEINETWETFKAAVKSKRDIDDEYLEGQTLDGQRAWDAGFIDGIGTFEDVARVLQEDSEENTK